MDIHVGQGIWGKTQFKDGPFPEYSRPYLVVEVCDSRIGVLTISSTAGKEHKLFYPSNYKITDYNPPFERSSFVKLDSLTYISISEIKNFKILHNGDCLNESELNIIINKIKG